MFSPFFSIFFFFFFGRGVQVNYACWGSDAGLVQRMRAQGVQSLPRLWEAFEERLLATVKRNGRRVILWQDAWEAGLRLPNDTILQVFLSFFNLFFPYFFFICCPLF